jgi:hypothetical protein
VGKDLVVNIDKTSYVKNTILGCVAVQSGRNYQYFGETHCVYLMHALKLGNVLGIGRHPCQRKYFGTVNAPRLVSTIIFAVDSNIFE